MLLTCTPKTISRLNRYRKLLDERDNLRSANIELENAYDNTLKGWASALELRDAETKDHFQRVTDMSVRLARKIGIEDDELINVYRGTLLHDITTFYHGLITSLVPLVWILYSFHTDVFILRIDGRRLCL